jgi:hypothetical protein
VTTKDSPIEKLTAQAAGIAAQLKANVPPRGKEPRPFIRVGIVMDDKTLSLDIPWDTIRDTDKAGLAECILREMQERGHDA